MCGICGIINFNQKLVQEASIRKMMQIQKHRGPDDKGVFLEDNIGLGFVRLSILDLSPAGHQPMFSHDERYVIVFNGEIYNYIELRDELKSKGFYFKTNTDTEVLLAAYQYWGEGCLEHFNGMWAFVIHDREKKSIFASRDRFGIKPFYYYLNDNIFAFASEIPPLLSLLPGKPNIDNQSMFDYLVFNRTDQNANTFFSEIKKLQHSSCFSLSTTHINKQISNSLSLLPTRRWYNLREKILNTVGFKTPNEFRHLFSSAVGLRLRSDVPVGVCLSGGLDSSSIVSSILVDHKKTDLQTFSVVFGESIKTDEKQYIKLYDKKVSQQHFNEINSTTYTNEIGNFVKALGEPVPSGGPFAQYNVMKIAKGNAVVLIDGQGADEILGGYKYFWGFYYNNLISKLKFGQLLKEIKIGEDNLYRFSTSLFYALPPFLRTRLKAKSNSGFISSDFIKHYSGKSTLADDLYTAGNLTEALHNHIEYKLEHLLKWEDRNSMWFGLEARVPFLDHRLLEKSIKTDTEKLMRNGFTKSILRDAMSGDVPLSILGRKDKVGFGAPQHLWFQGDSISSKIRESIYDYKEQLEPYFDYKGIIRNLNDHKLGRNDYSNNIWKVYNFILWFENHFS